MVESVSSRKHSPVAIDLGELIDLGYSLRRLPKFSESRVSAQQGEGRSRFRGRGMEFAEVRAYFPGDDVRSIDWRVTARRGKAHTKLFHEERDRPILIGLDYRRSMFFATRGGFKAVQASRLAALFAWQALLRKDRVGGFIFSEERNLELRPRHGRKAVLQLLQHMVHDPAWQRPLHEPFAPRQRLGRTLQNLQRVARPGSLILLLSDFNQWDAEVEKQLILLSRHCEIGLVQIYDPLEAKLPPAGTYRLSDGQHEIVIDTDSPAAKNNYRQSFESRRKELEDFCRRRRCRLKMLSTQDDPMNGLFGTGGV